MLGDIGGKGPAAARTTALARYTLRADTVHEERPSRILELLNGAIMRQAPGETCTVAYSRIAPRRDGRVAVTLSVAGDPLPLVVRAGAWSRSSARRHAPGGGDEPGALDYRADLEPGDAVLLYTDGLTTPTRRTASSARRSSPRRFNAPSAATPRRSRPRCRAWRSTGATAVPGTTSRSWCCASRSRLGRPIHIAGRTTSKTAPPPGHRARPRGRRALRRSPRRSRGRVPPRRRRSAARARGARSARRRARPRPAAGPRRGRGPRG